MSARRTAFWTLAGKKSDEHLTRTPYPLTDECADSFLATNNTDSLVWRSNFIRTYLETRYSVRNPGTALDHAGAWAGDVAECLPPGVRVVAEIPQVSRYIDLLTDLLLVRRLPPHANTGKRLVKSFKVYVRATGLLHALLGIRDYNTLCGHPVAGASWETFIIENLLSTAPDRTRASFYRTTGAEIDLLLDMPAAHGTWAIDIKRATSATPGRGFYNACEDVQADRRFVVYAGAEHYPMSGGVEAIGVLEMARQVSLAQG